MSEPSEGLPQCWTIGEVKITRIVEREVTLAYDAEHPFLPDATPAALRTIPWLYPHFVDDSDRLRMSIQALLVETPSCKVVVDTCIGNDRARSWTAQEPLHTNFLERFERVLSRHSVDVVVCTHLHFDHVGWNTMHVGGQWVPTFPRARYLFGRLEHAHCLADSGTENQAVLLDSVQPVVSAGLADLVETDHRISPEIRLVPTPGHTPGHVSVVVESGGQIAVITGDMTHHPCQMARPDWSAVVDADQRAAAAMRRRMFGEWSDRPILLIGTHYPTPSAGYVKTDGAEFRFDLSQ